jgi:aspartate aminotransferase-like enzyme
MINPRGPEFAILLEECLAGVRWGLQTHSRILLFGASGTGGLEAAVANLLSPGERAVFCTNGWFGEMWASMADAYGVDVVRVRAPWGEPVDSDRLERVLESEPAVGKVFLTHCETSTGVLNDVLELSTVARRYGCLVAVDSVSGVPCHPLPVDELGLDIVITASQKGWLAPPGLTMVAVSDAAMRAAAQARCPRWYLDFRRQASAQDKGTLPSTPPLSVMFALAEGLAILREEGLQTIWNRHARVGSLARRGLRQLGLELICAGRSPSNTVSVVRSPCANPNELPTLLGDLRRADGLILAAGLGELEGRTFRIGHLGLVRESDIDAALFALRRALVRLRQRGVGHDIHTEPHPVRRRTTRTDASGHPLKRA